MNYRKNEADAANRKVIARQIWNALPVHERSVRSAEAKAAELGYEISKSNFGRWSKEWDRPAPDAPPKPPNPALALQTPARAEVEVLGKAMVIPESGLSDDVDLGDIPSSLLDALDPRLTPLVQTARLDKVEQALTDFAVAVALKSDEIVECLLDPESETENTTAADGAATTRTIRKGQIPTAAAAILGRIAEAMKTIMAARTMASIAHRNYAEGDMLMGQGRKADAKARVIFDEGRADRAREIGGEVVDADDAQDALDALRSKAKK